MEGSYFNTSTLGLVYATFLNRPAKGALLHARDYIISTLDNRNQPHTNMTLGLNLNTSMGHWS